jgi:hypothetical protein
MELAYRLNGMTSKSSVPSRRHPTQLRCVKPKVDPKSAAIFHLIDFLEKKLIHLAIPIRHQSEIESSNLHKTFIRLFQHLPVYSSLRFDGFPFHFMYIFEN